MYSQRCGPDAYVFTSFTNGVTISMLQQLEMVVLRHKHGGPNILERLKNTIPRMLVEREKDPGYPKMW
jgi:hypothetical protein